MRKGKFLWLPTINNGRFFGKNLNSSGLKGFMPLLMMSLKVLLMPLFIATLIGK